MIGRPASTEAESYYFRYIDQVVGEDLLGVLEEQLEHARGILGQISEAASLNRYAPGKWSVRQVLNHVNDSERIFAGRALWIARGLPEALPGFDEKIAADAAEADAISWAAHVEEFCTVRLSTISLCKNLPAAAWARTGIASGRTFSVRALGYIIAGHLPHHLAVLKERYRVAVA